MSNRLSKLIESGLEQYWRELEKQLKKRPLSDWNESVFRFQFIQHLRKIAGKNIECHREWFRYDLYLRLQDNEGNTTESAIIEFKIFGHPRRVNLCGTEIGAKGGPGEQNEREFNECIAKLANFSFTEGMTKKCPPNVHEVTPSKFLLLIYFDPQKSEHRYKRTTYRKSYSAYKAEGVRRRRGNWKDFEVLSEKESSMTGFKMNEVASCILFEVE